VTGENGHSGAFGGLIRRLTRRNGEQDLRTTLAELVDQESGETPSISPAERQIIENSLSLSELSVADVMAPRADIDGVDISLGISNAVQKARETYHSRLPVYRGDLDEVIGMVHVKDLLVAVTSDNTSDDLAPLLRDVLFVVPSMRVIELLLQMQVSRTHMALVVDEYGGIDGLVTVEDVVEEIIGEMRDEHDNAVSPEIIDQNDGSIIASARTLLEDFEEKVGFILTEDEREEIDTIGGLVVSLLGRVPTRGEIIAHESGVEFEVLAGDPRRVHRLRVKNIQNPLNSSASKKDEAEKQDGSV